MQRSYIYLIYRLICFANLMTFSLFSVGHSATHDFDSRLRSALFSDRFNLSVGYVVQSSPNKPEDSLIEGLTIQPGLFREVSNSPESEVRKRLAEDVLVPICSTPTGSQLCQIFLSRYPESYVKHFKNQAYAIGSLLQIAVVEQETPVIKLSGFTTNQNPTVIINMNDVRFRTLARTIVHELYQTVDTKNYLAFQVNLPELYEINVSDSKCAVESYSYPNVRMVFSAIRAFEMEDQIITEIDRSNTVFGFSKLSCRQRFERLQDFYNQISRTFSKSSLLDFSPSSCFSRDEGSSLSSNEDNLQKRILNSTQVFELIERFRIRFKDGRESLACDFFSTPDMRFQFEMPYDRLFVNGPRPKIGEP